jgi:hypothetical protein
VGLLTLAGLGVGAVWQFGPSGQAPDLGLARPGESRPQIARRLITYRLDPVRPTVFRFSQPLDEMRIIAQPVFARGSAAPGETWIYSIQITLLDAAGNPVGKHHIHARSIYLEADGIRRAPLRYYRGSTDLVATADEFHIAGAAPVAAIQVLAGPSNPDVIAIDVRVGEQRPLSDAAAQAAFSRFSPEDRARLSAANAFPAPLLTGAERASIARNQWRPVGPVGIDGRDYRTGVLYEEAEPEGAADGQSAGKEAGG